VAEWCERGHFSFVWGRSLTSALALTERGAYNEDIALIKLTINLPHMVAPCVAAYDSKSSSLSFRGETTSK